MYARVVAQKNVSRNHFVSTDLPENRLKMTKKNQDLKQLDEHSTDIFLRNLIDRYADRSYVDNVNNLCLAKFTACYYKVTKYDSEYEDPANDNQPQFLTVDVTESQYEEDTSLPQKINLISSKEVMRKRKVRAVVCFRKFNQKNQKNVSITFWCYIFAGGKKVIFLATVVITHQS